jgi:hypothetical protein
VAFGSGYPHFLETNHWITYGYAAPLGVLPCPTLSAVIGATLLLGALGSAAWSISLGIGGLLYGAVGVFVLGVQLDYVLMAGALVLLGAVTSFNAPSSSSQSTSSCAAAMARREAFNETVNAVPDRVHCLRPWLRLHPDRFDATVRLPLVRSSTSACGTPCASVVSTLFERH